MSDIGTPMSGTIPVVGTTGTTYATQINDFLEEVKERLEARVPFSSLLVGEFDQANNPIYGLSYLGLYENAASLDAIGSIQNIGGDLFWVGDSGAVQITTGTTINSAGIGGITGDYGGVNPAQLRFDDATKIYSFYDDFGGAAWAYSKQLGVDIAGGSTSLVRVRIQWGGSSSYTLTLPASLPATTKLLQVSSAGQMTATNVLANNEDIELQGTGKLVHGTRTVSKGLEGSFTGSGSLSVGLSSSLISWDATAGATIRIPLPILEENLQLASVSIYSNGPSIPTVELLVQHNASGTGSPTTGSAPATTLSSSSGGAQFKTTLTVDTPTTYNQPTYWLKATHASAITYFKVTCTYTCPA